MQYDPVDSETVSSISSSHQGKVATFFFGFFLSNQFEIPPWICQVGWGLSWPTLLVSSRNTHRVFRLFFLCETRESNFHQPQPLYLVRIMFLFCGRATGARAHSGCSGGVGTGRQRRDDEAAARGQAPDSQSQRSIVFAR